MPNVRRAACRMLPPDVYKRQVLGYLPCAPYYQPEGDQDMPLNGDYDFIRPIIRVGLAEVI